MADRYRWLATGWVSRGTGEPVDVSARIVHEDEHLIVCDKESGMAAVRDASAGEDRSLHALVSAHLGHSALIIHRLDRGTSGLIAFAKDRETHRRLSIAFAEGAVAKRYLAVALGHLEDAAGQIDLPLRTFGSGRVGVDPRGRPARTAFEVRERLADADLLEIRPATGRHHQIRVHLYAIGHPVLGDTRYGRPRPVAGAGRLMLHALELVLPDADGAGGSLALHAEPGDDFAAIAEMHRVANEAE